MQKDKIMSHDITFHTNEGRISISGVDPVGYTYLGDFYNPDEDEVYFDQSCLSAVIVWAYNLGYENGYNKASVTNIVTGVSA